MRQVKWTPPKERSIAAPPPPTAPASKAPKLTKVDLGGLSGRKVVALGFDQSANHFALSSWCPDDDTAFIWLFEPQERGVRRLLDIKGWLEGVLTEIKLRTETVVHICMEGPAYSQANAAHMLGEVHGVVKLATIRTWGVNNPLAFPTIVGTGAVKKFATSSGASSVKKSEILKAVYKKWGVDVSSEDMADSYTISRIAGALHTGITQFEYEREVLMGLERHTEWDIQPKPHKVKPVASR